MGSNKKGTVSPAAPTSSEDDAVTHLLSYSDNRCDTSYSNVVAMCGDLIIPCISVWSSSSLLMRQRISATADTCLPAAEKRCDVMKGKVPKSRSALSTDGIQVKRTHVDVRRDSSEDSLLYIFCTRREASDPSRVNASTVPWRVIQDVNPPPAQAGSREGFKRDAFLTNSKSGR